MKTQIIETQIKICSFNELSKEFQELIECAKAEVNKAYTPYSKFNVGAAVLLENGKIFAGNNQENAAYPSGLCAERVTMFYANAQYPDVAASAIAIAGFTKNDFLDEPITPCGGCRQVLLETENKFGKSITVLLYGKKAIYIVENIKQLLPLSFGKDNLHK